MQNNFKARRAAKPHQIVLVVVLVLVLETKNKADDADEKSSRPETMLGNSTANWRRHKGCKAGLFFNIPSLLLGGGRNLSALGAFSIANRGRFSCPQSVKSLHRWFVVGLTCALWMPIFARAHSPATEMVQAATNFLAALTPEQRAKATFEFTSAERMNFHFVPRPRKGLPLGELTPAQRHLASALLNAPLSHRGYFKVTTIMSLEQILFELENQAPRRNAELYYLSLFGTPGSDVWGFRFEGHHLTLNFTLRGDVVLASTPSFLGANPAEVRTGPRAGLRVLAVEEDLARKLVLSLDATQRTQAVFSATAPPDIITGNRRKAWRLEPPGIAGDALTKPQQETLAALIKEYLGRNRAEVAATDWAKIEAAGWRKIHFAWAGGLEPGTGHYYRVQGESFLFEYDNTQNNANHIHTVWRDREIDFGADLLQQHYEQTPHTK
jgi:hypothetical protein